MQIACTTTCAAAEVLSLLLGAHLRPGHEFRVTDPWPRGVPIRFTLSAAPPVHLVEQVRAIPDTTIVERKAI